MGDVTPLDLVSSMVLESGARWGEAAVEEQWRDMEALLSPGGQRKHFWLRARGRSKPLALDTPLPTPSGWTTMGEVRPGDRLLDETGTPCTVTRVGDVLLGEDCYRVAFDDGTSIVASGSHEWVVEDHRRRHGRSLLGISSPHSVPGGVAALPLMTTREMSGKLTFSSRESRSLSVPCARSWDLPEVSLPIPPYVLGYWLGDGNAETGKLTVGAEDIAETSARFEALGYPLHSPQYKTSTTAATWRFGTGEGTRKNGRGPHRYDTTRIFRELGVLGDKHIPLAYLRASEKQRLELLRGLMDSDGGVVTGQAVFFNINKRLAEDVAGLAASLGWKVRNRGYAANLNGKNCGLCYHVIFCPDIYPFHLTRKNSILPVGHEGRRTRHTYRMVDSIEPVPSVPVRCITVDAASHLYLAGHAGIPTHNSFDTGAATLGTMLAGGVHGGDEMYAAAAGREQAGILARKMRQIAECTPELATAVEVQNFRVVTPRTGAILDVISSDLATSWGKTPRWLFVDEICNHDGTEGAKGFVDALLTALPKRRDSVALMASTPSSPNHWSRDLWDFAQGDALWRCSRSDGPAPWQDPAELESERRRLPVALWRRLYLCEWAELDDALATLEQVRACIGHEGILGPDPEYAYVHGADLSYARDTTAVATCHVEIRGGREVLVVDRVRAWRPSKGRQIPLGDVAGYVSDRVREYGGMIHADPYQGVTAIQEWRAAGHQVKAATFNPQENSRRASLLLSLIRERQLDLPEDEPELFNEITSLRLAEGSTPGVLKLTTDGSTEGHFDRVMSLMLCAQELMTRPAGSWLDAYAATVCDECHQAYTGADQCPRCYPEHGRGATDRERPDTTEPVSAGGWMAAYGAKVCGAGHAYVPRRGVAGCPRCRPGAGPSLPRVAGIGR